MSFAYLASPYSHEDAKVREARYRAAIAVAAEMMRVGEIVFSPIAHTHEVGLLLGKEVDHDFWMRQDLAFLRHASKLVVLRLPGWIESKGVNQEIRYAAQNGIPIEYVDP